VSDFFVSFKYLITYSTVVAIDQCLWNVLKHNKTKTTYVEQCINCWQARTITNYKITNSFMLQYHLQCTTLQKCGLQYHPDRLSRQAIWTARLNGCTFCRSICTTCGDGPSAPFDNRLDLQCTSATKSIPIFKVNVDGQSWLVMPTKL